MTQKTTLDKINQDIEQIFGHLKNTQMAKEVKDLVSQKFPAYAKEIVEVAKKKYLAFDIGCIECSEPSGIIGIFNTKEEAEKACRVASEKQVKNWEGQHSMEVFEIN